MKKLLLSMSIFLFSGFAAAEKPAASESSVLLRSEMASPCRNWRFNSNGGYTCASYAFSMWIPDARDVDREIRSLKDRVSRLEGQLNALLAERQN